MSPEITKRQLRNLLGRQARLIFVGTGVFFLCVAWILYAPLLRDIRRISREWRTLQIEQADARRVVEQLRSGQIHSLPRTDVLPEVLNRLNNLARSHQIQFLAVTPGSLRSGDPPGLAIFPIELQMEGGYQSIGEFLGDLERTASLGGTHVRQLTIERDEHLLPRLRAQLSMEIILSEGSSGSP